MVEDIEYSKVRVLALTQPGWSEMLGRQIEPGLCSFLCPLNRCNVHSLYNYIVLITCKKRFLPPNITRYFVIGMFIDVSRP